MTEPTVPSTPEGERHAETMLRLMRLTAAVEAIPKTLAGPQLVDLYQTSPGQNVIKLYPEDTRTWIITSVVAVVTTGATSAQLVIGDRTIPLQQTTTALAPVQFIVRANDRLELQATGGSATFFQLGGRIL